MNVKKKIVAIVGIQISLIVFSFLTLAIIELDKEHLGNSINIAGLNRFLTSEIMVDVLDKSFHHEEITTDTLKELRKNIFFLKEGGVKNGVTTNELPIELEKDWTKVYDDFLIFESKIQNYDSGKSTEILEIEKQSKKLVKSSDNLVKRLTKFLDEKNIILIRLQLIFLAVNTTIHILLIFIIFRILNKETETKIRLERLATIGKIGASVAHDLRNPLTVIKGSFDILRMKKADKEFEDKQYKKISDSIMKIEHLTKDILDFSGVQELNKTEFGLLEVIKNTINETHPPKDIEIKLPTQDAKIKADKIKLQIVISNLLKNSIDAIGQKGTIKMDLIKKNNSVEFTITDSGKEIPPYEISKIFEPLYSTKQTGTGLGLSSAKRIIEQHGGTIKVKTEPKTFVISLPK